MSDLSQAAALITAVAAAGAGALVAPQALAGVREPARVAAVAGTDERAVPALADLAAERGLRVRICALAVGCAVLAGWRLGWTPALLPWLPLLVVCPVLGYVDLRTRLLPTALIAPTYGAVVVGVLLGAVVAGSSQPLLRAGLGWLVMGGGYALLWFVAPGGLGYGDVRLSGLLGLCLGFVGWSELVAGLYLGFLVGGLASLALIGSRRATLRSHLPFGPAMLVGALLGLLIGPALGGWVSGS